MDVIADAGAVGGGVIAAEDRDGFAREDGSEQQRDEVRLGLVFFAQVAGGIGAGGVEVAQSGRRYTFPERIIVRLHLMRERRFGLADWSRAGVVVGALLLALVLPHCFAEEPTAHPTSAKNSQETGIS